MRVLVVSDVHGNLTALEAVLAQAPAHDALWCLGDLVDFGPDPDQCVARLLALGARCVAGNHDRASVDGWSEGRLSAASQAALLDLPAELRIGSVTLRHSLAEALRPPTEADFAGFEGDLLLVGHTHLPLLYRTGPGGRDGESRWLSPPIGQPIRLGADRAIANPGSVGSCFLDPGRASALLYDDERRELTWLAAAYPVEAVLARLRDAGAPASLVDGQCRYVAGDLEPMQRTWAEHVAWCGLTSGGAAPPASGS